MNGTYKGKALMTKRKQDDPHGHHGTSAVPDRGRRFGTKVQENPMAGAESGNRYAYGRSNVEDSANIKSKAKK